MPVVADCEEEVQPQFGVAWVEGGVGMLSGKSTAQAAVSPSSSNVGAETPRPNPQSQSFS